MTTNVTITVTAYGSAAISDILGLEQYARPGSFTSAKTAFGLAATFEVTGSVWNRIRPQLDALTQKRIPIVDSSTGALVSMARTQPLASYTVEKVPGDRPRVYLVHGPLDISAGGDLTIVGSNLLAGLQASFTTETFNPIGSYGYPGTPTFSKGVKVFSMTAVAKGPIGNLISYSIEAASGAGSVTTTLEQDGAVYIKIVPAAGSSDSTSIAAQVNGDTNAASFVTAVALVASAPMGPTTAPATTPQAKALNSKPGRVYLKGGDGGGVALLQVPVAAGVPTNMLLVTANRAGNDRNFITLTINVSQLANAVTVTGTDIVVDRTTATTTLANLVSAINGDADAAALVTADDIGTGSIGELPTTYLYGGAGENVVCTVGGAPAAVKSQTDTEIVVTVDAADITAAGILSTDDVLFQMQTDYGLVSSPVSVTP